MPILNKLSTRDGSIYVALYLQTTLNVIMGHTNQFWQNVKHEDFLSPQTRVRLFAYYMVSLQLNRAGDENLYICECYFRIWGLSILSNITEFNHQQNKYLYLQCVSNSKCVKPFYC